MGNKVYGQGNSDGYSENKTQFERILQICECNSPFTPTQPILPQSGTWVSWAKTLYWDRQG